MNRSVSLGLVIAVVTGGGWTAGCSEKTFVGQAFPTADHPGPGGGIGGGAMTSPPGSGGAGIGGATGAAGATDDGAGGAVVTGSDAGLAGAAGVIPVGVGDGMPISLATTAYATCTVVRDGRVMCWGQTFGAATQTLLPARLGTIQDATAIRASQGGLCVITRSSGVKCLGAEPDPAPMLKDDGAVLTGVRDLVGGKEDFCASTPTATYCWGKYLELMFSLPAAAPANGIVPVATLVPTLTSVTHLALGKFFQVTSAGDGFICPWGSNEFATVGAALTAVPSFTYDSPTAGTQSVYLSPLGQCFPAGGNVTDLAAGLDSACAALSSQGVQCWSIGTRGPPGRFSTGTINAVRVVVGFDQACVLLADRRTVMCTGSLKLPGMSTLSLFPEPLNLAPGLEVTDLAMGSGSHHACVIVSDGSIRCWGENSFGQLGNGTLQASPPVPVLINW